MKIFLITDIHFGEDTNYLHIGGGEYINSFGSQAVKMFESLFPSMKQADLVVNLGDLLHNVDSNHDVENFKKVLSLFPEGVKVAHVRGNHDMWNISSETFCGLINEKDPYYSFDCENYHHVVLDGKFIGKLAGVSPYLIDDQQIEWLKDDLDKTDLK